MNTPNRLRATPDRLLVEARQLGLERWEAQRLLEHLLGKDRAWLVAHGDEALALTQADGFRKLCQRRLGGEPLAYLVGEQEFHGLTLRITPDVLVPRPDTETLVDWALEVLSPRALARPRVLDLGTGSGAIALALRHRCPQAEVVAVDISPAALAVARANGERLGLAVDWRASDWWSALDGERFDLIVSNPPYIAEDDPHLPGLHHEPRGALTPGGDGMEAYRRILAGVPAHLLPGGHVLLEHGWQQAQAVSVQLIRAGLIEIRTRRDLGGNPRCTGGRRPAVGR